MGLWSRIFGGSASRTPEPRAAVQSAGGGVVITTSEQLEEVLRTGNATASGVMVTPEKAMRAAAVYACVRIRSGVPANMP
ncbi:MAG: phage portal protein, partial [Nitrobacter sp.]|nr:phage portal protein [Nitrobacter sp.]